jgi:hypothetical protein
MEQTSNPDVKPQGAEGGCTCGAAASTASASSAAAPQYIYALGQVAPRFPRLAIEKEYLQVLGRSDAGGLTDRESLHKILSDKQHR